MKLFNVSRSKYRLGEIKNKNKYAIERKREIRSHLGNARLVSLSKKKKKNILRSKLLSIPINSFVRNFFSVQRLSEYLKIYDFQITEVVA